MRVSKKRIFVILILGIEKPPRPTAYLGGYIDLARYA